MLREGSVTILALKRVSHSLMFIGVLAQHMKGRAHVPPFTVCHSSLIRTGHRGLVYESALLNISFVRASAGAELRKPNSAYGRSDGELRFLPTFT